MRSFLLYMIWKLFAAFSSPWQPTPFKAAKTETTRYIKKKKKRCKTPAGSRTRSWDSLTIKMIPSWTRQCFPYPTSGLRSVERVTDISVRQYHSERFIHRREGFTALYLFSTFLVIFSSFNCVLGPCLVFFFLSLTTFTRTVCAHTYLQMLVSMSLSPISVLSDKKVIIII